MKALAPIFRRAGAMAGRAFPKARTFAALTFTPTFAFAMPLPRLSAQEPSWIGPANNTFAADLYAKLSTAEGNLFFSPTSLETALAMTYAGARGPTAEQMAKVLHLPPSGPSLHADLGRFLRELNARQTSAGKPRGFELAVANALWGQKGAAFLPPFVDLLKTEYGAGLHEVDFKTDREGARRTINEWVAKETRDKIKDLISSGALTPDTLLVLTNAIYFKGAWASPFEKKSTQDEPFHLTADRPAPVPMMHRHGFYGYLERDTGQALKLPYAGGELSMIVLLPRAPTALADFEKVLTADQLPAWLAGFQRREVDLSLPKFKLTAQFEVAAALHDLGMPDAFSRAADFSAMTGQRDFQLSNVIHKAFIEVNEEGSEAAAATSVMVAAAAILRPPPPVIFRADHPFLFLIRHEATGAILFLGRLSRPQP